LTTWLYSYADGSAAYFVQKNWVYKVSGEPAFFIDNGTLFTIKGQPKYWISDRTVWDYSQPAKAIFYFG
jgi:hypothetical protein